MMSRQRGVVQGTGLWIAMLAAGCGAALDFSKVEPSPSTSTATVALETSPEIWVGDTVVLRAEVKGGPVESYAWTITGPHGEDVFPARASLDDGWRRVSFPADLVGSYTAECTATLALTGWNKARVTSFPVALEVRSPFAPRRTFRVRIIPPPEHGIASDVDLEMEGADKRGLVWHVEEGLTKQIRVEYPKGVGVASTMRLLRSPDDPLPRDVYLPQAGREVKVAGLFHALFLPVNNTVAPALFTVVDAAAQASPWTVQLTEGFEVKGVVQDAAQALAGATVVLHATPSTVNIAIPSTVGTTGQDGAFSLRTGKGTATLTVVPPPDMGFPVATVDSLDVSDQVAGWLFEFQPPTPVDVTGTVVTRADGKTPASGATVVLSAVEVPAAGTLSVGGQSFAATGRYERTLVTDDQGLLRDPQTKGSKVVVPAGTYEAKVWPGKAEAREQGFARIPKFLVAAPETQLPLALALRAHLTGWITAGSSEILAEVTAAAATGSFSTTTTAAGTFELQVDVGVAYTLSARPVLQGNGRLGSYWAQLTVAQTQELLPIPLPRAALIEGTVETSGRRVVPGALMRIWCTEGDCPTKEILDETRSGPDGSFVLRVPVPTP